MNEAFSFTVTPGSAGAGVKEPIAASENRMDSEAWASDARPRRTPAWVLPGLGLLTAATVLIAVPVLRRQSRKARQ